MKDCTRYGSIITALKSAEKSYYFTGEMCRGMDYKPITGFSDGHFILITERQELIDLINSKVSNMVSLDDSRKTLLEMVEDAKSHSVEASELSDWCGYGFTQSTSNRKLNIYFNPETIFGDCDTPDFYAAVNPSFIPRGDDVVVRMSDEESRIKPLYVTCAGDEMMVLPVNIKGSSLENAICFAIDSVKSHRETMTA